ncbi:MAG TPA: phosphoribosylformylglycinamidine synthase subunit PurQ [Thermoanaerobaculia bacterium]|nr:phosphoribosylformylglycinamidine synthase subunit PurQ [Thermoanaerobaculia bacterium]HSN87673.1 phosphoribosylformylglycinamidine synthase subunit PurQ [Thermoanaerobaculia bacterium]
MRAGVVVFPGSNCDHDVYHVLKHVLNQDATFLWHQDDTLKGSDLVVLPGGFSYGDYLRAGALAALSPIMGAVKRHAEAGGMVLGICNGFQVLLEAGLLPGAMRRNKSLRFLCRDVHLKVERADLPYTRQLREGQVLRIPIAHAEGNYEDAPEKLDALEANRQVVFRYVAPDGSRADDDSEHNPNGSARAIAGICNAGGNVLGMMPHPERCSEQILGNTDGLGILASAVQAGSRLVGAMR